MSSLKWGILGAGKIAHDFIQGLRTLSAEEHEVLAVGSSSLERCSEFCKEREIPRCYGSYEELCRDGDIEAVYIASYVTRHTEHVELCLQHGKHILCEQTMGMNLDELKRITKLAKEKNLLLMEGCWTRFFPLYKDVQKMITDGKIGEVKVVIATFGYYLEDLHRIIDPTQGSGTLLEMGCSSLNIADMMFGGEEPLSVSATGHKFDTGVDHTVAMNLLYSRNRTAHLITTAGVELPNDVKVIGTKGSLTIESPLWCPTRMITPDGSKDYPLPPTDKPTNYLNSAGLRYEIAAFGEYIKDKRTDSIVMPHATSQRIMGWFDEIRRQMDIPLS